MGDKPIYLWDEARRAVDSLQMYLEKRWLISYYDNNPETPSTKSPFLLWLQVVSLHLFGLNEWAIRFPSAVSASLTGIALWWFGRKYFGNWWVGFLAGSVFAATYALVFNHAGRTGDYDALLSLFTTLSCLCFFLFCTSEQNRWLQAFWLFFTLAVFTKGIVPFFFIPSLLLFVLWQGKTKLLLYNKWLYLGALFLILFMGSYYAIRIHQEPEFFASMYQNELGGRFASNLEGNKQPFAYYLANFLSWRYDYWAVFLALGLVFGLLGSDRLVKRYSLFCLLNTASFMLIISIAETKLFWYDLPVYPFFSIQIALLLHSCWATLRQLYVTSNRQWVHTAVAGFLYVLCFTIPLRRVNTHNLGVYQQWPWDVDGKRRQLGLYLQKAIRNDKNLDNHVVYYEGTNTHLNFYIKILQARNIKVHLTKNADAIQPGSKVVISQPELIGQLMKKFRLKEEESSLDCRTYSILPDASTMVTASIEGY